MLQDFLQTELYHHGRPGQKWGVRNGPPYPLKGNKIQRVYYKLKKKGDKEYLIRKGDKTQTLSYDKNRLQNADMYYAALSSRDKDFYKTMFNKKVPNEEYDTDGKCIGPSYYLKYNIRTQANKDVKMANERQGIEAFTKLMENSRDFQEFVLNKDRMESLMDERRKEFPEYKEALKVIDKVREDPKSITSQDAALMYRVFNYVIPAQGKDIERQRARFFKELKQEGFGAVLDTNDAMYGKFHRDNPAIIFDTDSFDYLDSDRVSMADKRLSTIKTALFTDLISKD